MFKNVVSCCVSDMCCGGLSVLPFRRRADNGAATASLLMDVFSSFSLDLIINNTVKNSHFLGLVFGWGGGGATYGGWF